ncbi:MULTISPECIES: TetR/AcrR family transcriptional regulator [Streptomyces]|uniref:TetR/AcrR family transcriptional regulator n=1 Tax=Streptomyces sudanensis TaxID=436397 RepID=A0ABY4TCM7_9ACTN|nr:MULTISPECIES: TetR/AcrR family transcriptional regulator [Streptomyces]MCP9958603.1 TetR/AcrR family transcriptional regulator [Streptomyces sudanensis]MCP9987701.1 TetR/AcrR family transcriptional regulator [Streptomyces sudanensis]MCQ0000896.1 TetR/AcrR family transcriptional regulator [Streptomyces sudanensis]URN16477.1 TetR/AcrR family transcriptional regulator [Streptomyces sudanensis]
MGRTSTARERLLDAACGLMLSRGYGTIGVAEICARAEVKKGSFYHFFESKQALTIEAINAHWAAQRSDWTATLRGDGPAEDRLERLFLDQAAAQRAVKDEGGAVSGCLFGNLALEMSNQDEAVQARLAEIFDEQIDLVHAALKDAAEQGAIPEAAATRTTARAVLAQLEGTVMFAKLANDPSVMDGLWSQVSRLLRS